MMPLVEVVEAEGADPAAVQAACAFVKQIDKLPLPVKSAPGFLVNVFAMHHDRHFEGSCMDFTNEGVDLSRHAPVEHAGQ